MKTLKDIQGLLKSFETKFGYRVDGASQGSEAWMKMKLGVVSASNASKAVAKIDSETRFTYMAGLIAQVCTGVCEEINGRALDWGNQNEDASRSYYEFAGGHKITQVPFVFMDDSFRIGCSPDGLVTDKKGVEIKCPFDSANYIKFLLEDSIKPEWKWQYQFCLWVLDAEQWDFSQFDPRMKIKPMKTITVERDEKMQATLRDAVPQFLHDMDAGLKEIGIEFGTQWLRLKEAEGHPVTTAQDHSGKG